ncbi:MAG TPA: protein translocase subunit SecF [Verrucomicrobiae bacterium]|nr:protein translocase subunit SecF [Verrucomicrobiae bacterium]
MELFKSTNYDFLGKKWPFIIASLILSAAGIGSIIVHGGLNYSIDFKGGAQVAVRFKSTPPMEKIRTAMQNSPQIHGGVSVQNFTGGVASNTVLVETEIQEEKQLNINRQAMVQVLANTFGEPGNPKLDLNNATTDSLQGRLRDALAKAGIPMSETQIQDLAKGILSVRDNQYSGLLTDFHQLATAPGMNSGIMNALQQETYLGAYHIGEVQMVGPKVGAELQRKAVLATLYALAGMLVYIAFRFEWIYGLGAVIACFHDTIITIGLFSIFNEEISMTVIAALLTLVGYSMNDTIVIFDRIRENLKISRREPLENVMNKAVNQTLSRTVMTSGLTFLTVIALFAFGGPVLHGFSFALVCGIIVGTYSSVFVASPIVLFWHNYVDQRKRRPAVAAAPVRSEPAKTGGKPPAKSERSKVVK